MISKALFLYLFIVCKLSTSKRISSSLDTTKSNKLEECQRCKILTDSFTHWLTKTSRGKHEGGDAAWEEAKLKTYSRSEMRLVDIQEGLCSEVKKYQDLCYTLAEEAEQVLEKWWFHEDPDTVDLFTWLCIDNLKYCCPSSHFGALCLPCPLYEHRLCGGHGKCEGEGTRKGNGTCICHMGYTGNYCEVCSKNYYSKDSTCVPCHRACEGCSGGGANSCKTCRDGWIIQSGVCVDVDECIIPSICKENQFCVNREGSYVCKECEATCKSCRGIGPTNCTRCKENYILWSNMCIDEEQKYDILSSAMRRSALYVGLLIITIFILRNHNYLASVVIIIVSMYIYFSEKSSTMNLLELASNIL